MADRTYGNREKRLPQKKKRTRNANMGWAKTMIRKSNQKIESDDPIELAHNRGFCAGIRYAVSAAGFKYAFDEERHLYDVTGRRDD